MNPRLQTGIPPREDADSLFKGLVSGDRGKLARAITLVESGLPTDRSSALSLLDLCMPHSGRALRIGISGSPGVGKSTFIDVFGRRLLDAGRRVAVLAVDPSSQRTGGSILGDKTRMGELFADPRAFIRPSPASGTLGGVARATRPCITLCEAAGYDTILVETVGVGQSETTVRQMVDSFLFLAQAGAGDELQGIKRGILEAADVIAVTKADGDGIDRARSAQSALRTSLSLLPADEFGWKAPVLACSSVTGEGLQDVTQALSKHRDHLALDARRDTLRERQALQWMRDEVSQRLLDHLSADPGHARRLEEVESSVRSGRMHPYRAAESLVHALASDRP